MFGRKKIADDLKAVTEVAGDQIAPGAGTLLWVLAAAVTAGAAAYAVNQRRKKKKAAQAGNAAKSRSTRGEAAFPKPDKSD